MKVLASRESMNAALAKVIGRTKGHKIPILSHVLVRAAGTHHLEFVGHDMTACASVRIQAEVDLAGAAALPADRLRTLIGGFDKGSQVSIAMDGDRAVVRSGKARYHLPSLPAADFPELMTLDDPVRVTLSGTAIGRIFDLVAPFVSPEETRHYLGGINLQHHKKDGILACATDGHTLLKVAIPAECQPFTSIIVGKAVIGDVAAFAAYEEAEIEITDTLFAISSNDHRFVTRLVDGTFPDYERVIPERAGVPLVVSVKECDAALARLLAARDADAGSPAVWVRWAPRDEGLTFAIKTAFATGEEVVGCEIGDRDAGEVGLALDYLRRLLAAMGSNKARIYSPNPGDPVRFENPDDPLVVGVLMPRRA